MSSVVTLVEGKVPMCRGDAMEPRSHIAQTMKEINNMIVVLVGLLQLIERPFDAC